MKTKDKNMITEELLAAFEEGKTNAEETALVLEYLATDESLQEEFILSQQLDAMMGADDEETDFLPMAQMAAKSEGNLCDFQCEQFILKRRKIEYNSGSTSLSTNSLMTITYRLFDIRSNKRSKSIFAAIFDSESSISSS